MAMEPQEKKRVMITAGVGLVLCLATGYALYSQYSAYGVLVTKNKSITAILIGLKKQSDELPTKNNELLGLRNEFAKSQKQLPEETNAVVLQGKIEELSAKNQVMKKNVTYTPGLPGSGGIGATNYVADVWKYKWNATMEQWVTMMTEMEERFDRFVSFENLKISSQNTGVVPMGTQHEITVDIVTYRYIRR